MTNKISTIINRYSSRVNCCFRCSREDISHASTVFAALPSAQNYFRGSQRHTGSGQNRKTCAPVCARWAIVNRQTLYSDVLERRSVGGRSMRGEIIKNSDAKASFPR
jgi:hypothetical protein